MGSSPSISDREHGMSSQELSVILTKLAEALPPLGISQQQWQSKLTTYLETLSWWNRAEMEEATRMGLKTQWKFFPTVLEITQQCEKAATRQWAARQEAQIKALPVPVEVTDEDRARNLKVLADLKLHFRSR